VSLYISVMRPSSELEKSPIDVAITVLAANAQVEKRTGRLPQGPALDITFMLPHKDDVPNFQGMRMGGYTEENKTLFFESAVPEHIVHSKSASRYVLVALQDAIENASEFFENSSVKFDKANWYQACKSLAKTASVLVRN